MLTSAEADVIATLIGRIKGELVSAIAGCKFLDHRCRLTELAMVLQMDRAFLVDVSVREWLE